MRTANEFSAWTLATVRFLASMACLAGLVVSQCSLHAQARTSHPEVGGGPAISPTKGYVVQEIRDGLYWISDGAYNTMFLVTPEGVIAVDAPPTLGPNYLKAIAEVTAQPVKYLVYSHEHTDHIGAAYLFPKDVKIVAQKETAEILAQRKDARRPPPTITFADSYELHLGDQTLTLNYPGINHERGNILIYAAKQKTLMLVDQAANGFPQTRLWPTSRLPLTQSASLVAGSQQQSLAEFSLTVSNNEAQRILI